MYFSWYVAPQCNKVLTIYYYKFQDLRTTKNQLYVWHISLLW